MEKINFVDIEKLIREKIEQESLEKLKVAQVFVRFGGRIIDQSNSFLKDESTLYIDLDTDSVVEAMEEWAEENDMERLDKRRSVR